MSFDERMQMLTDYVYQAKHNSRIQWLIKSAKAQLPAGGYACSAVWIDMGFKNITGFCAKNKGSDEMTEPKGEPEIQ